MPQSEFSFVSLAAASEKIEWVVLIERVAPSKLTESGYMVADLEDVEAREYLCVSLAWRHTMSSNVASWFQVDKNRSLCLMQVTDKK
jgi:hypothetical protein